MPKAKPFLVSTWYRPPSANSEFFSKFQNFLKRSDNENIKIVITVDFNCGLLKTREWTNNNLRRLTNLIDVYQLQQHITTATRTTTSTRAVARALIGGGGCIFIYSCYARLISFEISCY